MPNRTNKKKDGNQTWIDFLCYEMDSTFVDIATNKRSRQLKVVQHLKEIYEEKLEAVGVGGLSAAAFVGGTMIGALPLMLAGGAVAGFSLFAWANRTRSQAFAEKESQFLRVNSNILEVLASIEQRGEAETLTLADLYNDLFARCAEGPHVIAVSREMFQSALAHHCNTLIAGKQTADKFAESLANGSLMDIPDESTKPVVLDEPEPEEYRPRYKHSLLCTAEPTVEVLPPANRLDPEQIRWEIEAGQINAAVAAPSGYPAAPIGVIVISPADLNNINKYPFVMVVAGQGSGKSVTMAEIMTCLSGHKALSTPKADDHKNPALASVYSLRFGFDPITRQGQQFGDSLALDYEQDDLDDLLASGKQDAGTILEFTRSAQQTANNRNARGKRSGDQPWRLFYDEAAQTYSIGFLSLGKKQEDLCKTQIEAMLKYGLFNFRGSSIQLFLGCQSETVDSVGLKGVSAARDEAWHLYPGRLAIEKARMFGQPSIAAYLERLLNSGYAIALLEKQGVMFEVLQLPKLSDLTKYDPIVDADSQPVQAVVEPIVQQEPAIVPPQPQAPANPAAQMQQMMAAMMASGMLGDTQDTFRQYAEDTQRQLKLMLQQFQNMQEQMNNTNLRLHQVELNRDNEDDESYGAIDQVDFQPVNGSNSEIDAMAVLLDALEGLKQEAELKGQPIDSVFLTSREFSRKEILKGTKYDGSSSGGSARVRELFDQFARNHVGTYQLGIANKGQANESWRLKPVIPNNKSTTTKAKKVKAVPVARD